MDVSQNWLLKYPNSTEDLATYLPLELACLLYVREKETSFSSYGLQCAFCLLQKKKNNNCKIYLTGEHLQELNQHELRGSHFTSWIDLHYILWNYWAAVREKTWSVFFCRDLLRSNHQIHMVNRNGVLNRW